MAVTTDNIDFVVPMWTTAGVAATGLDTGAFTITLKEPDGDAVTGLTVAEIGSGLYRLTKAAAWGVAGVWSAQIAHAGAQTTPGAIEIETPVSSTSAAAIADAVWDEALSGHTTDGTAGGALGLIRSAQGYVQNPFAANTLKITIGYGEDRTTGSPNGALALTTVASVDLEAVGSTIYFAVRRKSDPATADALFTLTGTATDTLTYTVELSKTYTRQLMPGTYLWSAWHLDASGDRTNLGSGAYVVEDLVQPTV